VLVQGVDREAAGGEMVGLFGVEEVVGEAVHQQHSASRRRVVLAASHQRGDEVTFAVGIRAKAVCLLPVTRQHIGLPSRHNSYLSGAWHPTRADEAPTAPG